MIWSASSQERVATGRAFTVTAIPELIDEQPVSLSVTSTVTVSPSLRLLVIYILETAGP